MRFSLGFFSPPANIYISHAYFHIIELPLYGLGKSVTALKSLLLLSLEHALVAYVRSS